MKKFEIFENTAFYDCVANNDILTSVSQSIKWSDEAHKRGLETLYIASKRGTAFKVCYGSAIEPIRKNLYDSEYAKHVAASEVKQSVTVSAIIDSDVTPTAEKVVNVQQAVNDNPTAMTYDIDFYEKVKSIVIEVLQEAIAAFTK